MRLSQRQHRTTFPLAWVAWLLLVWAHIVHPVHSAQLLNDLRSAHDTAAEHTAEAAPEHSSHTATRGPYDCPHQADLSQTHPDHGSEHHDAAHTDHAHEAMYCPHCTVAGLFWLPAAGGTEPPVLPQYNPTHHPGPALAQASPTEYPQQPRAPPL
ncbi:hypothetical protein E4656_19120 [Natronospirillum operosum]|uniref:DUF2946 domain-containing protein n=1 Tax=Natronospirillum operosum TaxID=2759953 RepID=A0A4Z0WB09_9GAMM|nr:hypothetical protein [Natronospirillum operosum]TGG90239.1 hypothetical protein E4656_19120 [Natronospirillum operosum]